MANLANTKLCLKKLRNDWNPGTWVLIWECSARAIQWIPTWQGLDGFQNSLLTCALDENSLSIGTVKFYRLGFLVFDTDSFCGQMHSSGRLLSSFENISHPFSISEPLIKETEWNISPFLWWISWNQYQIMDAQPKLIYWLNMALMPSES